MIIDAAIDNDFMNHLAETKLDDDRQLKDIVRSLFLGMGVSPVMHELVYCNEFDDEGNNEKIRDIGRSFISDGIVSIKKKSDYIKSKLEDQYYSTVFEEIYRDFKGDLPVNDIWKEWKKQASLGETHTVTMCVFIKCGIFLSDDNDSRQLREIIDQRFNFSIKVYNRSQAVDYVKEQGKNTLKKRERRALAHKR